MEKEIIEAPANFWKPQPKSRLVSIVSVLQELAAGSQGELTVHELTQVLISSEFGVYDGDTMMIYWGGCTGLAEPIIDDPFDGNSGYNRRVDIVIELYNAYFWENTDATIVVRPYGRTYVEHILVSKDDALEIGQRLWRFFYPNQEKAIDLSGLAEGVGTGRSEEKPGYSTPGLNELDGYRVAPEGLQIGGGAKWPWGDYETELLRKLAMAADRFWKLYDPTDNTTAPTNQQVIEWLKQQGVAERNAEVMATILRVDGLPTGPRK